MRFIPQGISPKEDRVKAIHEASPSEDAKALRSFLCSSRFMPNICKAEQDALNSLKRAISTKFVGYFNKNWCTVATVDASPVGLGAVLQQYNPINPKDT